MTTSLTNAQATERNTDDFIQKYGTLCNAGIGVVLCRTREPLRASDAIREFATASGREFRLWTMSHGWALFDPEMPDNDPSYDGVGDPIPALRKISDPAAGFSDDGFFVMMYPHKALNQFFLMVQVVKDYCRMFSDGDKRLMLVVPPSYQIPEELQDDLVVLDFEPPSYAELNEGYVDLLTMLPESAQSPNFTPADLDRIMAAGAGMTALEFDNAVSRALILHRAELPNVDIDAFVKVLMDVKTEVVKRSEVLEVMEPGKMSEIGGLENLKAWIAKRGKCFGQEARDAGIEPPKGIALIGPPGTGKSLGAKAVASELGIPALKFDVGKVFNSLVGASEQRVRDALKMVDAMAPCVLMIDEADKAFAGQAGGGSGGDSGVGMRVLGAILTWMQETTSPVFLVVTANRVQNLPTEFLRRGRLDEIFSVTVPHEGERLEILKIHLAKRKRNPEDIEGLETIAANSSGYVPAELEAAVKDALIEAFTQEIPLTGELIQDQLRFMKPLSVAFADDFNQMQTWAENNARPASLPLGATTERARATTTAPRERRRAIKLDG